MKIKLLLLAKHNAAFISDGCEMYLKRLKKYGKVELHVIPDPRWPQSMPVAEQKKKEADLYQKKIKQGEAIILLDENGKRFDSRGFAAFIQKMFNSGSSNICFVVGGPYGFDEDFKKKAKGMISMSEMTFSHQLIRLIFLEQLYRAFSILNNEPYHND